MLNKFKHIPKFSKQDRLGVVILSVSIVILQIVYWLLGNITKPTSMPHPKQEVVSQLQQQINAIKKDKINNYKFFNPNYLNEYKAYKLGLNHIEFKKLLNYRAQNKWINSAKEFQSVTHINDSLLSVLIPYFKLSTKHSFARQHTIKLNDTLNKVTPQSSPIIVKDLNLVIESDLIKIKGIGSKLSKRIIKYRNLLKGFTFNKQLYEVWYLDRSVADQVLKHYQVLSKPQINKVNINTASFKEVMHSSPYIDYQLTKRIFNYKRATGKIMSLIELKAIDSFPIDKFDRISLYLSTN